MHSNRTKKPRHTMSSNTRELLFSYESYKPNIVQFCELLAEENDILCSDITVRKLFYQACLVSSKTQRKTKKKLKKESLFTRKTKAFVTKAFDGNIKSRKQSKTIDCLLLNVEVTLSEEEIRIMPIFERISET